jgi:5'-3' exonuclease
MGNPVSMEWMFPWHLPPTWNRLENYTKTISNIETPKGSYILQPQEQLALVLPIESWGLVRDKQLQKIPVYSPSLWPKEFKLFMAGKRAIWECEAIIPLFTPERLRYLLRQIK